MIENARISLRARYAVAKVRRLQALTFCEIFSFSAIDLLGINHLQMAKVLIWKLAASLYEVEKKLACSTHRVHSS